MNIMIEKYGAQYWKEICRIHDEARKEELKCASLEAAFLPLEIAAEKEGLFAYKHIDIALQENHAVGFCAYSEEEIAWLYVLPEKKRQGIGRQLVAHALSVETDIDYVEALFGNEPAKKLYESFGFSVREIVSGQMPGNEQFLVNVYSMYRNQK